jgi:hypothetical protein
MPIDVKRLAQVHIAVPISVMDDGGQATSETLNIWIRPISPALRAEWKIQAEAEKRRAQEAKEKVDEGGEGEGEDVASDVVATPDATKEATVATLADLLVRWDVTDGGEPVKPSAEFLSKLDDVVLLAMYKSIHEYYNPNWTT